MGEEVMRQALETVVAGRSLDVSTARAVMDTMMEGEASPAQVGALVAALRTKGESVDELSGMVESMRAHATRVSLPVPAVDTCGTGGGIAGAFNISTVVALRQRRRARGARGGHLPVAGRRSPVRGGGRDRLPLCTRLPPGPAPCRSGPARARNPNGVQRDRAARQPRSRPPPIAGGFERAPGADDGRGAASTGAHSRPGVH